MPSKVGLKLTEYPKRGGDVSFENTLKKFLVQLVPTRKELDDHGNTFRSETENAVTTVFRIEAAFDVRQRKQFVDRRCKSWSSDTKYRRQFALVDCVFQSAVYGALS